MTRVLGSGSFAHAFEAVHELLQMRACLKVGRHRRHSDGLLREARLLWDLHHPALPSLHDVLLLPDGAIALAMRLVEGRSLDALMPIDVPTGARLMRRLLSALRTLHGRGIVHNDVKPANIVVEPDRHGVVLVDLGSATQRASRGEPAPQWTRAYAAPEVVAGETPLPASDLYSLGMSMLHALGGDIRRRVVPSGVPDCFLSLLLAMTSGAVSVRPRWGRDDPAQMLDRMLPALT